MGEFLEFLIFVGFLLMVGFGVIIYGSVACANKADLMQKHWNFGITTGCMVEHKPGEWIPISQYRVID